ncbi:polyketide beta-ketoacyl-synthase [Saxophila tyrrhenica]|uniref:Polyketide beta-ketoacyl-synthase n=1 Tax=Saxophila tyrrhenica TaxID=1690608 RepID=A0AAV9P0K9_9PEZI|nr:polyketide beta-ketoacyl-synthase [Saxophila tyrrhenica]
MAHPTLAFFGGQGSRALFGQDALKQLRVESASTHAVALLLTSCHSAFLSEVLELESHGEAKMWASFDGLGTPEQLVSVPKEFQSNPIVEGVMLCLRQLKDYLVWFQSSHRRAPTAVAGFCSGAIPAMVAASAKDVPDFIERSKEAIRLAFSIGLRVGELSYRIAGGGWQDRPWSLAVRGLSRSDLEDILAKFNEQEGLSEGSGLLVSTISNTDNNISIVGEGSLLARLRSTYLPATVTCRDIQVHGLYHGRDQALSALESVLADVKRRHILFPTLDDLRVPAWTSQNESSICRDSNLPCSLLEHTVRGIMVQTADWASTWTKIISSPITGGDKLSVVAIGPGAYHFLSTPSSRAASTRAEVLDVADITPDRSIECDQNDIAIVGMSARFPLSSSRQELWNMVAEGKDALRPIPESRFGDVALGERSASTNTGNFLDDPFLFDHEFFNISPREAKSMDPQQKLLLRGAKEALDDAGYVPNATKSLQAKSTGCYIGAATEDYAHNLRDNVDTHYSTGTLRAFLSGKVSYAFGLSGPSSVIDTACSSSLVAISQACRALVNGDCSAALAGGVNAMTSLNMYLGLSRAHFLSPTGQCKSFSDKADGYSRSEGCGLFVLKRLPDAIIENDHIHGVIKAAEVNHSGMARSITHPHQQTQEDLYRNLLSTSGIDPASITVVEAHGTGTQAGDTVEVAGLHSVFGSSRTAERPLYIGSIKANIGHLEAAAGAAGLAKVLCMFREQKIPPQISARKLNPGFPDLEARHIQIPTQLQAWNTRSREPRKALLNSFGAAGSNAAIILQEWPAGNDSRLCRKRTAYNCVITAKRKIDVQQYCSRYLSMLTARPTEAIEDICYTSTARRQAYDYRISLVCQSTQDLAEQLETPVEPVRCSSSERPYVLVFSGQGCFYPGMSKGLLTTMPVFREAMGRCDEIITSLGHRSVLSMIEDEYVPCDATDSILYAQLACFFVEYALATMWMAWNVRPAMVVGHSLGEYVALVVGGVLSLTDALRVVAHRAELMIDKCRIGETAMLACNQSACHLEDLICSSRDKFNGLSVACKNSPVDTVVSGPVAAINSLQETLRLDDGRCQRLQVPLGYHSTAVDAVWGPLRDFCANVTMSRPSIPTGSCLHGRMLISEDISPKYLPDQMRGSVRFADLITSIMASEQLREPIFIETGPSPITLPLIRNSISDKDCLLLPTLKRNSDPWVTICSSLRTLSLTNNTIRWRAVFDGTGARLTETPAYPFQQQSIFCKPVQRNEDTTEKEQVSDVWSAGSQQMDETSDLSNTKSFYPLDNIESRKVQGSTSCRYELDFSSIEKYVLGHVVGGWPLCPASIYHGILLEALITESESTLTSSIVVQHVHFSKPLLALPKSPERKIALDIQPARDVNGQKDAQQFTFSSCPASGKHGSNEHCTGSVSYLPPAEVDQYLVQKAGQLGRRAIRRQAWQPSGRVFDTHVIYNVIFPRIVAYSSAYHTLRELTASNDGVEAWGLFRLPACETTMRNGVPSATFVDTLLHAAGFLANVKVNSSEACICAEIQTCTMSEKPLDCRQDYQIYCRLQETGTAFVGESYAMDSEGSVLAAIEGMKFNRLQLRALQTHLSMVAGDRDAPGEDQQLRESHWTTDQDTSSRADSAKDVESTLHDIAAGVSGLSKKLIDDQKRLEDLGFDSLLQLELRSAIRKHFSSYSLELPPSLNEWTLCTLRDTIVQQRGDEMQPRSPRGAGESTSVKAQNTKGSDGKVSTGSNTEDVVGLISRLTGTPSAQVSFDAPLDSLGIDSLMMFELQRMLYTRYGQPQGDVQIHSELTVQELQDIFLNPPEPRAVDKIDGVADLTFTPTSRALPSVRMAKIQVDASGRPPLFLFHDGSGTVECYRRLKQLGCDVFAIANPIMERGVHWAKDLVGMARHYAAAIAALPTRTVILSGWSFGGVLAYEIAQHLAPLGTTVQGVMFIDSPPPIHHEPLPPPIVDYILNANRKSKLAPRGDARAIVASQFEMHARFLAEYSPSASEAHVAVDTQYVMLQCQDTFDAMGLCGVEYAWLGDSGMRSESTRQWECILGRQMVVLGIPGNHFEPFSSSKISSTSTGLKKAYDRIALQT